MPSALSKSSAFVQLLFGSGPKMGDLHMEKLLTDLLESLSNSVISCPMDMLKLNTEC